MRVISILCSNFLCSVCLRSLIIGVFKFRSSCFCELVVIVERSGLVVILKRRKRSVKVN